MKYVFLFFIVVFGFCHTAIAETKVDFDIVTVADGLNHPWSVTFLPGGDYLVTERRGQLWRIRKGDGLKTQITGVPDVYHAGQGGLLDVILDPDFQNNNRIYFSYAATDDDDKSISNTEIARARFNTRQNRLTDVEVIFRAQPKVPGSNHWGSRLAFANDGTLYITLGEKFDFMEEAQNPSNHLGTVVRINADGSIPSDNPFVGDNDKAPEIFSYGHRNPQGIAVHPETGEIWIHEHGPKGGDEINILKSGANYGWPAATFGRSYWGTEISDKTSAPGMEDPILQWTPSIAPSGMTFYTGDQFPQWKGDLFVGALVKRHLRRVELDGETVIAQEELLNDLNDRIRDVRQGPEGYIYILSDSRNGKLYRLGPR
jgi:glucose/arabinose dehydrogenase